MLKVLRVAPVITAGAYSANDAVGAVQSLPTGRRGKGGIILGLSVYDKGQQAAALQFFLFNRLFTGVADNAPFNLGDTDVDKFLGIISVATGDYLSLAAEESMATIRNIGLPFKLPKGLTNLYFQVRTPGTPTYTSTDDLRFIFHVDME